MLDIAWSELLLVAIVAILVVGPKELPVLLRSFGRMLGKLRRTADDFRRQFDDAVREAGGDDLQREMRSLKQNNPLSQVRNSIEEAGRDMTKPAGSQSQGRSAGSDDMDDDELGPPPPPLPPHGDKYASDAANANRSGAAERGSEPANPAAQTSTSSAQGSEDGGSNSDSRLNGQHRAAG